MYYTTKFEKKIVLYLSFYYDKKNVLATSIFIFERPVETLLEVLIKNNLMG